MTNSIKYDIICCQFDSVLFGSNLNKGETNEAPSKRARTEKPQTGADGQPTDDVRLHEDASTHERAQNRHRRCRRGNRGVGNGIFPGFRVPGHHDGNRQEGGQEEGRQPHPGPRRVQGHPRNPLEAQFPPVRPQGTRERAHLPARPDSGRQSPAHAHLWRRRARPFRFRELAS